MSVSPAVHHGGRRGRLAAAAVFVVSTALAMVRLMGRHRRVLWATTRVELEKRFAGSAFGKLWVVLLPILLLGTYVFVFRVVFGARLSADAAARLTGLPADDPMLFVLYVFCGLIPYIGFSEAVTSGCLSLKQNIHLVKNVIVPIELIAPRVVAVSLVSQGVSLGIVTVLTVSKGLATWHLLWLPVVVALQALGTLGLVWVLSAAGVLLSDIAYFMNVFMLFLLYVSPVAFEPSAVPVALRWIVYANPTYYMIESYRSCLLFGRLPEPWVASVAVVLAFGSFALGAALFRRLQHVLVDYD